MACGTAPSRDAALLRSFPRSAPCGKLSAITREVDVMRSDAGERQYELVEGWGKLPAGWRWGQCGAVAVDSKDQVHVFTRTENPYMVFDKAGNLVESWGR